MARIKKLEDTDGHIMEIADDHGDGELILVRGGQRAYIWAGKGMEAENRAMPVTISGKTTLRKLAHAILKEVGP